VVELGPKGQRVSIIKRAYDGAAVTTTGTDNAAGSTLQSVWLRLTRVGNDFVGQVNLGADRRGPFTTAAQVSALVIPANAFVGVVAASGSAEASSAATLENVTIAIPKAPTTPPPGDAGIDGGSDGGP